MHNLIREIGENVLREEYRNSRIWLPKEVHDLFAGKLKTNKVERLRIPKGYRFEDDHVNYVKVFKKMESLQVLIFDNQTICSEGIITCLPSSLRWIEWPDYPSSSLPEGFDSSHLVGLCLHRSRLVELWPIRKKLSNLKHLDLRDSLKLTKTPNFGDMPILETLNLWHCENLEEVHPSIGHCQMLTSLILYGCVKLKKLPKFVTMESLETLSLDECTSLEEFPEICGDMPRLSKLGVGSPWIRSLPPSLSALNFMKLRGGEVLQSIPDASRNLESLYIEGCNKLATLPNSVFESQQLEELSIIRCSGLVEIPTSLGVQKKLFRQEICWGIRLEYENKNKRWRRKQRATQGPKLFPVLPKDSEITTEIGCSRASAEYDIATYREVDQAAMIVQKEHKSHNVELIRVCGSPSRKMDDVPRKRKRKRNRKKKRKIAAATDERSLHDKRVT
ncbi:putative dirigent protein 18-like [Capsicum annuum]|nr:putative dirigent protein 18-like [Capsicum annuum]